MDEGNPMGSRKKPTSRSLRIAIASVVGLFLLANIVMGSQLTAELFTGWVRFSFNVIPQVRFDWGGIGIFAVGFVVAAICLHVIAVWLTDHLYHLKQRQLVANSADQQNRKRWRLRSTLAVLVMFLSIFVVGISMAGIVHQTGWVLNSPDGIAVSKVQLPIDARLANYDPLNTPTGNSWITACIPFISNRLEGQLAIDKPFNHPINAKNFKRVLDVGICPAQGNPLFSPEGFGLSQITANPSALGGKLTEKNSTAIMLGEVNTAFDPWGSTTNQRDPGLGIRSSWKGAQRGSIGYGSVHPNGANVYLIDGSIKFIDVNIDPEVLKKLAQASSLNLPLDNFRD